MSRARAASLLLFIATEAVAQNAWVEFGSTDGSTAYFDQTSIRPDLSRDLAYFAWWRADLRVSAVVDGKPYKSHLTNYRVDCTRRTLQQREMYFFSPSGTQVARDGAVSEVLPTPGTLGESFVKAICARAGR